MRTVLDHRFVTSLGGAAVIGAIGPSYFPFPANEPILAFIYLKDPIVYQALASVYMALWYSTAFLALTFLLSGLFIFVADRERSVVRLPLPPYPDPTTRPEPFLILGEQHFARRPARAREPRWLTIPERGLFAGVAIFGAIGTGKTSGCMYPYAQQLLTWAADDPDRKMAGLVLEVKGDFCHKVRQMLAAVGRQDDYIELSLDGAYCYNPIHGDLEPYALAYSLATLINQLYGRSKEPFWQQAYTNLVKFVVTAARLADGYTTLADVYHACISPDTLHALVERARRRHITRRVMVDRTTFAQQEQALTALAAWTLSPAAPATAAHSDDLVTRLHALNVPFETLDIPEPHVTAEARERLAAVERWYDNDWLRMEPRLRTSIVEGIAVVLSLFDDNPRVKRVFCPGKEAYEPGATYPLQPLPLGDLLEQGKVVALNFPTSLNPGLARILGTLLKQDFQRAMLHRIPRLEAMGAQAGRNVLFMADEYQYFATAGGMDPSGDDRFFALSRQARCIPIVATQSVSSLRSALPDETAWRTLLQCFRTKLFLALSDDFSAQWAAELSGRARRLQPEFTVSEAGQDASVSLLTGKAAAPKATITTTKHYNLRIDYVFQPKIFAELRNAQAIALPYDGSNPLPPTYCYLKPYYLDVRTSYFDHVARGDL
ncbi:MAG: type IV secretory system conjugative DNA transfer family protein [Vicinamibacteraceae bacterium]